MVIKSAVECKDLEKDEKDVVRNCKIFQVVQRLPAEEQFRYLWALDLLLSLC